MAVLNHTYSTTSNAAVSTFKVAGHLRLQPEEIEWLCDSGLPRQRSVVKISFLPCLMGFVTRGKTRNKSDSG